MKRLIERSRMIFVFIIVCGAILYSTLTKAAVITTNFGGSWEFGSIWDSGVSPGAGDDVIITDGNNVSLSSNVTVASLTINSADLTIFTINSGYTLTVTGDVTIFGDFGSTASQIACNGNIIIGGNLNFQGMEYNAQAQLSMGDGSSATLSGEIVLADFGRVWSGSTGNIHTITFNGSVDRDIRFTGNRYRNIVFNTTGNVTMLNSMTATTVYGNIDIQNGTLKANGYTITGNSGRNFTVRNGATLELAGTAGLPATFSMVLENGSTVRFAGGDQTVGVPNNSQNYSNLQVSGTGTKTLGGSITVTGNLTVSASTLDASASNYNISLAGNFINSGTFTARSATVTMNGSSAQAITSGGSSFYNLTVNNSHVNGVTINDNATITNTLTLTDGVVSTGVNTLTVESNSAGAITGYSSNSFVNGRLRRYIASNTSTYAFPVGNSVASTGYHLAEIINNNMLGVSYIDARFGALVNHDDADLSVSDAYMTYLSVAPAGIWHITPNSQPSSNSYDIRLSTANMGTISDNQFGILKRDDGSPDATFWGAPGSMNADNGAGRLAADGFALRTGLSSFSEFALGRASTNGNPLPIELVSFTAKVNSDKQVQLQWLTAIEINNDYFTIERSTDGVNFEFVGEVAGAGNTAEAHSYGIIDANPASGINYYRLKQTDFDGAFEYSGMVSVTVADEAAPTLDITVYPNPANVGQTIQVNITNTEANFTIQVYEVGSGKLVYQTVAGSQTNALNVPEGLAAGAYLVRVANDAEVQTHKLLVR